MYYQTVRFSDDVTVRLGRREKLWRAGPGPVRLMLHLRHAGRFVHMSGFARHFYARQIIDKPCWAHQQCEECTPGVMAARSVAASGGEAECALHSALRIQRQVFIAADTSTRLADGKAHEKNA
jgi:hypothetical protein